MCEITTYRHHVDSKLLNSVQHLLCLGMSQLAAKLPFACAHSIESLCLKLPLTVTLREIFCKTAATAWYVAPQL
jgi:hypothetical protein